VAKTAIDSTPWSWGEIGRPPDSSPPLAVLTVVTFINYSLLIHIEHFEQMAPNPILDIPGFLVCPPPAHRVQSGALPGFAIVLAVRRVVHVTHKAIRQ
jgi:hypothetical protein